MNKEYKLFVVNQIYGFMKGEMKSLEEHMNKYFKQKFNNDNAKIVVKLTQNASSNNPMDKTMSATITINNFETFTCKRNFGEELIYDSAQPECHTDDYFYESDKCFAHIKAKKLISQIEKE